MDKANTKQVCLLRTLSLRQGPRVPTEHGRLADAGGVGLGGEQEHGGDVHTEGPEPGGVPQLRQSPAPSSGQSAGLWHQRLQPPVHLEEVGGVLVCLVNLVGDSFRGSREVIDLICKDFSEALV